MPKKDTIQVSIAKVSDNGVNTNISEFTATKDHLYRIYESIWRNMDRENNLINQRITWAILLTSGILTAETFLMGRVIETISRAQSPGPKSIYYVGMSFLLCAVLSFLAAAFCYRTKIGVAAAQKQITYLKDRYERLTSDDQRLFQDVMRLPRPYGNPDDHRSGAYAAKTFPNAMMIIWIIFGLIELVGLYSVVLF